MRRAAALLLAVSACDLDVGGAFDEYCREHPGRCGSDGGSSTAGGSTAGGSGGNAAGGSTSGGTGGSGGSGGAGGGVTGDAGVTLDRWCEALAQASSDRAFRCAKSGAVGYYSTAITFCERSDRPRAVKGYLRYDQAAAEECLANYAAAGCNDYEGVPCRPALVPNATLDGGCETGDCVSGYCEFAARFTPGLACPTCQPLTPLGGWCPAMSSPTANCGRNAYCGTGADGGGACTARKSDGAPCQSAFECASNVCTDFSGIDGGGLSCGWAPLGSGCVEGHECVPTAYCAGLRRGQNGAQLLTAGVCSPRLAPGAACADEQFDDGCPDGGSCLDGACAVKRRQLTGQSCDSATQCDRGRCTREFPYQANGSPALADGTCFGGLAPGATCTTSVECTIGHYCEMTQCAPVRALGASCPGGESCGVYICQGLADGGATCQGLVDAGAPCVDGANRCPATFTCTSYDGGPNICQRRPDGQSCSGPPQCESLRCAGSVCAPSCFK